MKKYFALLPLLALACGASADPPWSADPQVHVIVHPDAQYDELTGWSAPPDPIIVRDGDPIMYFDDHESAADADTGDIGQSAQALTVPSQYGFGTCPSSSSGNPCLIGKDKQIRPAWGGGPTTHPATPGVDYKVEMGHAVQRLQQQGTNWSIRIGGDTTHDFVGGSGTFDTAVADGLLGQTRPWDYSSVVCSGGACTQKFNGFAIDLNPSTLADPSFHYCDSTANCQFFAETVIQHELVHGMGMNHSHASIGTPGSFMRAALELHVDTNMNQSQKDALNNYQP